MDRFRPVPETSGDVAAIERLGSHAMLSCDTIYEMLRRTAAQVPEKAAILHLRSVSDRSPIVLDYANYLAQVEQAANLFHAVSAGEPAVVAVIAPYLPEALVAMWGGATAGRYVPINPFLQPEHVTGILRAAGATVLVTAAATGTPGVWDQLEAVKAQVPTLQSIFRVGAPGCGDDFASALASQSAGRLDFAPSASAEAECAYMHTGGTTATPKLVRHTHGGQLLQAWLCGVAMGPGPEEIVGHAMPNFHVGGAVACGVRGLLFGQTLLTLTPDGFRDPELVPAFWDVVSRFGMTAITTTPTTVAAIHAAGGSGPASLRRYTTGGGPLPVELARSFRERFGLHLREVWGGTEFHGILSFHYGGEIAPRLGSCGRSVPFHRVMPAILEGSRFVRRAEPGERAVLIATGPTVSPGYVDPSADAGLFIEDAPGEGRWATTGDVGTVDPDGFVWILGREKDVIVRGGHNIDSAMIDEVLLAHPDVVLAAAVGRPCPLKGELPMAFVQLRSGAAVTAAELVAFARGRMAERAAAPVEIVVIDEIPLTAVGKVSKPPLRLAALQCVAQEVVRTVAAGRSVAVQIEEEGGRAAVVLRLTDADHDLAERLAGAFAHFTFETRLVPGAAKEA
jgi:fatty-acyl-CoA synthase